MGVVWKLKVDRKMSKYRRLREKGRIWRADVLYTYVDVGTPSPGEV